MASSLNISLTDELRRYVDLRASDKDVYATPSEYIRDLIRRDMEDHTAALSVAQGLRDILNDDYVPETILDILYED